VKLFTHNKVESWGGQNTTLNNTCTQNTQIDIWLTWQRGKAERPVTSVPCGRGNVFGMLLAFTAPLKV